MVDVKKTIKTILVRSAMWAAILTAAHGGMHAYLRSTFTPEQQRMVQQVKARGYSEIELHFDINTLGFFNKFLESAQDSIGKGNTKDALDSIINANDALSKIRALDTREERAKLLEVRKELQKNISKAKIEEVKKDKRLVTAEEVRGLFK